MTCLGIIISILTIIISIVALITSIWSAKYNADQNKELAFELEKREALKLLVELIGGLGSHFLMIHQVGSKINGSGIKEILNPIIESFNEKDIITQLTSSTLLLPEHEDRMILSQKDFIHLNNITLLPVMITDSPIAPEQLNKVAIFAERTMSFYHDLREIVRNRES